MIKEVPITCLSPDPDQPRKEFGANKLKDLAKSIKENGIMNPIVVEATNKKNEYSIVDGERRYRASKMLKLKVVPIRVLDKELSASERTVLRFQLQETHSHWSVFEKAEAMAELKQTLGVTDKELALVLGVSWRTCESYIAVLDFSPKFRQMTIDLKMPLTYLQEMARLQRRMPFSVTDKTGDYLGKIVDKYKKGYVNSTEDLRKIHRLVTAGEDEAVINYINEPECSAEKAMSMSDYMVGSQADDIVKKATKLIRDIKVAQKREVYPSPDGSDTLKRLIESIEGYI